MMKFYKHWILQKNYINKLLELHMMQLNNKKNWQEKKPLRECNKILQR